VLEKKGVVDKKLARAFGLTIPEQVVVMFHCGSRGFGHQVATDYLELFLREMPTRFGLEQINRELACAPFDSEPGRAYFAAMGCASNMAFANRQVILHRVREVFGEVLRMDEADLEMEMVYDVAHNTAKLEQHLVDGEARELLVHRKGATRAFPPGHPELPERYRETGQPVIVGGSMESASWLLAGVESGARSFYSSAHGAGRTMSRARARKLVNGSRLLQSMSERGIHVRAASLQGLAEEAGIAYKNVDEVAEATELAGLSRRVARLTPVGNVKG
jgi:tRNA-splicing ligase RtcB